MELYPLVGLYRQATRHTSPESVPRTQVPTLNDGTTQFRFKYISNQREMMEVRGVQHKVYIRVLETKDDLPFKENDEIIIGTETFRLKSVDKVLPKEKEGIVRRWPLALSKYQVIRLTL